MTPFSFLIAAQSERNIIGQNLPAYIESLPHEIKKDARYLSKFVVGAGFGLFDYSLNAIWNEVVIDLRKKAIAYGIDIFFDSAVGGKARDFVIIQRILCFYFSLYYKIGQLAVKQQIQCVA